MARAKLFRTAREIIDGYNLNNTKRGSRKVSLYGKTLLSGKVSLILYGRNGGKAVRQSTGVLLEIEETYEIKRQNEEKIRLQRIKCDSLNADSERKEAGFAPAKKSNADLLTFIEKIGADELHKTNNPDSYYHQLQSLSKHIEAFAGRNTLFKNITKDWCRGFLCYLKTNAYDFNYLRTTDANRQRHFHIKQNTMARLQRNLSYILNKAVKASIIATNPMSLLDKDERIKAVSGTRNYLESSEIERLKNTPYLHGTHHIKEAFLFACYTGLRFSDLKQLRQSDFHKDKNGNFISIIMQKTREPLKVYVPEVALQMIPNGEPDEPIFRLPKNDYANSCLRKWLKDAGITDRPITFHCARHSAATILLSNGIPLAVVGKQLGHVKSSTTQIYAKLIDDAQKTAADKIDELFYIRKPIG